jgi:hypothetical protein
MTGATATHACRQHVGMQRIMDVQLKSGYNTDRGPAWIMRERFSKSCQTAYFRGCFLLQVSPREVCPPGPGCFRGNAFPDPAF